MKISKRLSAIADYVDFNSRVIDCGCDHGLLSIYLEKEKKCVVLATDVNEKALHNAVANIKKYHSTVLTKLTDGINGIDVSLYDTLVIAGMGTSTIKYILDKKKLCNHLVISSNNQIPQLRKYIVSLGYYINKEMLIIDRGKKYIIIDFVKGYIKYHKIDFEYGPILQYNKDYLLYELKRLLEIKKCLKYSNIKNKIINRYKIYKINILLKKSLD